MDITLAPTKMDEFAESATYLSKSTSRLTDALPVVGNAAICIDSVTTTGRAAINFCSSPNTVARVFFGTSCLCGVLGAASSGTALATLYLGVPVGGWIGSISARGFNRLGRYTLKMGKVTSTNAINIKKFLGCQYLYHPRLARRICTINIREADITSKSYI